MSVPSDCDGLKLPEIRVAHVGRVILEVLLGPPERGQRVEGGPALHNHTELLGQAGAGHLHVRSAVAAVAQGREGVGAVLRVQIISGRDGILRAVRWGALFAG